jgi:sec-independent protein translocase protein TatC
MKTKPPQKHQRAKNPDRKSFLEHLTELKNRFLVWLLALIIFSVVGYLIYPQLFEFLVRPLNKPLYYTSPAGGFETVFNLSLFFGFIASLPVLIYQSFKFVVPGFNKILKFSVLYLTLASLILALSGIVVCYYLILPPSLSFLSRFGGGELVALISTRDYFSFAVKYLVSFAVIFQMPLIMILINKLNKLSVRKLLINFRYVLVFAFLASAILTPTPDFINQAVMAAPILLLYLLSVVVIWVLQKIG